MKQLKQKIQSLLNLNMSKADRNFKVSLFAFILLLIGLSLELSLVWYSNYEFPVVGVVVASIIISLLFITFLYSNLSLWFISIDTMEDLKKSNIRNDELLSLNNHLQEKVNEFENSITIIEEGSEDVIKELRSNNEKLRGHNNELVELNRNLQEAKEKQNSILIHLGNVVNNTLTALKVEGKTRYRKDHLDKIEKTLEKELKVLDKLIVE